MLGGSTIPSSRSAQSAALWPLSRAAVGSDVMTTVNLVLSNRFTGARPEPSWAGVLKELSYDGSAVTVASFLGIFRDGLPFAC